VTRLTRTLRAFTAIEISMVITVIAILALLILPLFRDRVEAARQAAVQDELSSLAKAEMLVYADIGFFVRLQDLDNTSTYNDPPVRPDQEIPIAGWNRALSPSERARLVQGAKAWKGPYITMNKFKYMTLDQNPVTAEPGARQLVPEFFWSGGGFGIGVRGGPMMDLISGVSWLDPAGYVDWWEDRIIIDPWGTPYIFFGTGKLQEENGMFINLESNFGNAAIYSLGPDGFPGDGQPYQAPAGSAEELLRDGGNFQLGAGDDYVWYL
jgi:type II secretory pathway pseudopilin PulG